MLVPIPVSEVMSEDVRTVGPDATARETARTLRDAEIGSVVVVDDGEPVGIVTETDLVALFTEAFDPELPVTEFMSRPLETIAPDRSVESAAARMYEQRIKKLAVVEDGDLVGVVTTTDLSNYLPRIADSREDEDAHDRIDRNVRVETAYEHDDWAYTFESRHEDRVEVGDVARFVKTLSDEDLRAFAEATGDTNRLHLDDEFAATSRFGRRIAHGTLVTGVISAALARLPGLTIYLSKDLHFMGPVEVGERVTAECRVTEDLGKGKYRLSTTVTNEADDTVVDGSTTVLIDELADAGE